MSMNAVPNEPDPRAGGREPPSNQELDRRLTVLETRFDIILPTLATKSDVENLRAEIRLGLENVRAEFRIDLENLRAEFRIDLERLRGEFRSEMKGVRGDLHKAISNLLKWMIGLYATMFIGLVGVNFAMFNATRSLIESYQKAAPAIKRGAAVERNASPPRLSLVDGNEPAPHRILAHNMGEEGRQWMQP